LNSQDLRFSLQSTKGEAMSEAAVGTLEAITRAVVIGNRRLVGVADKIAWVIERLCVLGQNHATLRDEPPSVPTTLPTLHH
jgi:hypothetical protein